MNYIIKLIMYGTVKETAEIVIDAPTLSDAEEICNFWNNLHDQNTMRRIRNDR
jgi:hypothetical protein